MREVYILNCENTRRSRFVIKLNVKLLIYSLVRHILEQNRHPYTSRASWTRRSNSRYFTSNFYLSVLTLKCFSSSPYKAILTLKTKAISRMCEIFAVKLHVCVQTFPIMSHKLFLDACFPRRQTCLNFQMLPIRFGYENSSRVSSLEFTIPRNQSNAEILVNVPHVPSGCSMKTRFAKVIIHVWYCSSALGLNYDLSINIVIRQFLQKRPSKFQLIESCTQRCGISFPSLLAREPLFSLLEKFRVRVSVYVHCYKSLLRVQPPSTGEDCESLTKRVIHVSVRVYAHVGVRGKSRRERANGRKWPFPSFQLWSLENIGWL